MIKINTLVSVALIFSSIFFYFIGSYVGLYLSFSCFLLYFIIKTERLNAKFFAIFFFMYYAIPFLNISTYRGEVSLYVLGVYSLIQFLVIVTLSWLEKKRLVPSEFYGFVSTEKTEMMYWAHIGFIYIMVLYVYATIGFILIRQDLRFTISPMVEYIIKSGLVLPLIWVFSHNFKPTTINVVKKFLLPILPSLLIGSRGTFIMILISIMFSFFLFRVYGPRLYIDRYSFIFKKAKRYSIVAGVFGVFALYTGFYIRRDGVELITANELLYQYEFISSALWVKAILPLYIGLRESVGITDRIIMDSIINPADYPMFFMEMITFLPGHQEAPGIILARDIYMAEGADEKYSLTPGIVGGLYIDYGFYCIPMIVSIAALVVFFYNRGISDLRFRMIYSLSIVQFFHLYHRGFLKLEYLVPYFVLIGFFLSLKRVKLE
jgi:hypothetical protein